MISTETLEILSLGAIILVFVLIILCLCFRSISRPMITDWFPNFMDLFKILYLIFELGYWFLWMFKFEHWMEILAQILIIIGAILVALLILVLTAALIYWRIFVLCHTTKLTKSQEKQLTEAYEKFRANQRQDSV